ncbi:hypothetical protein ACL9RF_08735 [Sphingobacterium sp. Mn56C]|uniref:hypothetical protein n=1 Tax=Sphingobacterium sp. Mn56C TaxID=3395261 RepID=UPI003BD4A6FE
MKKQSLLLLCLGLLFAGPSFTSCSKDDAPKTEEPGKEEPGKEEPGNQNISPYLKGSDYYLLTLDEQSEKHIKTKIKKDYRVDDIKYFLYVWDGTYTEGTSSGPNAFGEVEGWASLKVGTAGWSGCGFAPFKDASTGQEELIDFSGINNDFTFHIAMKSKDKASHTLLFNDGKRDVKVVIGDTDMEGEKPYKNFTRDGEWHHIEIPYAYLAEKGLKYEEPFNANIVAILSGGVVGTELNIDGLFFFKK